MWWHMLETLAIREMTQEHHKFEANRGETVRPGLKKEKKVKLAFS